MSDIHLLWTRGHGLSVTGGHARLGSDVLRPGLRRVSGSRLSAPDARQEIVIHSPATLRSGRIRRFARAQQVGLIKMVSSTGPSSRRSHRVPIAIIVIAIVIAIIVIVIVIVVFIVGPPVGANVERTIDLGIGHTIDRSSGL